MKRFYLTLVCLSAILLMTSCGEEEVPPAAQPTVLEISIHDKEGNDLLNPNISGNIVSGTPAATYQNKRHLSIIYTDEGFYDHFGSNFFVIVNGVAEGNIPHSIRLGAFWDTVQNGKITIDWGEGIEKDEIAFSVIREGSLLEVTNVTINGKEIAYNNLYNAYDYTKEMP